MQKCRKSCSPSRLKATSYKRKKNGREKALCSTDQRPQKHRRRERNIEQQVEARDLHELDVEIPASKKVVVAPGVASESCIEVWDYGAPRDDADGRRQAGIENLLERRGDFCVRQQSGGLDVLLPVCCRIQTIEKKSDVQSFVCLDPTIISLPRDCWNQTECEETHFSCPKEANQWICACTLGWCSSQPVCMAIHFQGHPWNNRRAAHQTCHDSSSTLCPCTSRSARLTCREGRRRAPL